MRICMRACLPLALGAVAGFAQPQPEAGSKSIPLSKVERKNQAPVSSEILRVNLFHHQQHLSRSLLDGRVVGIFRGIAAAILSVAIQAVQAQRSSDESHRGHKFVHGNSSEHLDVFEDLLRHRRLRSCRLAAWARLAVSGQNA